MFCLELFFRCEYLFILELVEKRDDTQAWWMNGKENSGGYHAGEWCLWASLCGHRFLLCAGSQSLYFFTHATEVLPSAIDSCCQSWREDVWPSAWPGLQSAHRECGCPSCMVPAGPRQPQDSLHHRVQCLRAIHTGYLGPMRVPERNRNLFIYSDSLHSTYPEGPSLNQWNGNSFTSIDRKWNFLSLWFQGI